MSDQAHFQSAFSREEKHRFSRLFDLLCMYMYQDQAGLIDRATYLEMAGRVYSSFKAEFPRFAERLSPPERAYSGKRSEPELVAACAWHALRHETRLYELSFPEFEARYAQLPDRGAHITDRDTALEAYRLARGLL